MTTDSQPRSLGAVMSAETGYETEADDAPIRISGFISVLLGLLGGFSIVAWPMAGVAAAGALFGLFGLRKYDSKSAPVGTTAARIGVMISLLFGSWGIAYPLFKQNTLGNQATHFAKEYIRVVASGNLAYAAELQKSHYNRYLTTMDLEAHYQKQRESHKNQENGSEYDPMEVQSASTLSGYDPDHEWILDRPVRVFHKYGHYKAEVILASDRSAKPTRLMMILEYRIHKDKGTIEWNVETFQHYRKRIVAPTVL